LAMARPPMQELVVSRDGAPLHQSRPCAPQYNRNWPDTRARDQLPVTSPTDIRHQTWPGPRLSGALIQLTDPQTAMRPLTEPEGAIGRSGASRSLYVVTDPESRHAPRDGQVLAVYSVDRMASSLSTYCLVDPFRTVNRLIPPNLQAQFHLLAPQWRKRLPLSELTVTATLEAVENYSRLLVSVSKCTDIALGIRSHIYSVYMG
jgi:hypothetical protein